MNPWQAERGLITAWPMRWHFPAELEQQYRDWFMQRYEVQLRFGIIAGVVVFFAAGIVDPLFLSPTQASRLLYWRYGVMLPAALALLAGIFSASFLRHQQVFLWLTAFLAQLGLLLLASAVAGQARLVFVLGMAMALFYALVFLRLRLPGIVLLIVLVHLQTYVAAHALWRVPALGMAQFVMLEGLMLLGLFAAYGGAYQARQTFLLERDVLRRQVRLTEMRDRFQHMSEHDALTGLYNRRALLERLDQEWGRAHRYGYPVAMVMIDIDYFKQYNDRYGHLAGDAMLQRVAEVLRTAQRRPGDLAVRWGGDEFLLLWPGTQQEEAAVLARQLLQQIQGLAIEHEAAPARRVSLSFGVAAMLTQEGDDELLVHRADTALYAAKAAGRDRVAVYQSTMATQALTSD